MRVGLCPIKGAERQLVPGPQKTLKIKAYADNFRQASAARRGVGNGNADIIGVRARPYIAALLTILGNPAVLPPANTLGLSVARLLRGVIDDTVGDTY